MLFLIHTWFPQWQPVTSKFFTLSGYNAATGKYAIEHDDLYFVGFCVVLFIGIRAGSMKYVLAPLARSCGLVNKKRIARFSEQGWMFMYNSVFWTLGTVFSYLPINEESDSKSRTLLTLVASTSMLHLHTS